MKEPAQLVLAFNDFNFLNKSLKIVISACCSARIVKVVISASCGAGIFICPLRNVHSGY
jgi:hypothetical protein